MSHTGPDKLVYMANQIGRFFVTEDRATAVSGIADHLRKFWDPRMRAEIGRPAKVIATGGLAVLFDEATDIFDSVEPDLTLEGLALLAERASAK